MPASLAFTKTYAMAAAAGLSITLVPVLMGYLVRDRDLGSYVAEAQAVVAAELDLPAGYSIAWSGQYEYMVRAKERLTIVVPFTLTIIILLLYLNFRSLPEVLIILGTLPMALVAGVWLLYLLEYELSVAVGVGFIALSGVAVEIGVVMRVYLNQTMAGRRAAPCTPDHDDRRRDHRRPTSNHARRRHWFRRNAPYSPARIAVDA